VDIDDCFAITNKSTSVVWGTGDAVDKDQLSIATVCETFVAIKRSFANNAVPDYVGTFLPQPATMLSHIPNFGLSKRAIAGS
jgi:hypothetical protein